MKGKNGTLTDLTRLFLQHLEKRIDQLNRLGH